MLLPASASFESRAITGAESLIANFRFNFLNNTARFVENQI